jgi:hypothetical protein
LTFILDIPVLSAQLFADAIVGQFCVRNASNDEDFVLSVLTASGIKHLRIVRGSNNRFSIDKLHTFDSVPLLVSFHLNCDILIESGGLDGGDDSVALVLTPRSTKWGSAV